MVEHQLTRIVALHAQRADFNAEMGYVLFRCGAEKLCGQLQRQHDDERGSRTEVEHVSA